MSNARKVPAAVAAEATGRRTRRIPETAVGGGGAGDGERMVVDRPIEGLKPFENNARKHSRAQIKKIATSIEKFGFINPVLVDGRNRIVAGHGRVEAARLLGRDKVPTLSVEHLSDDALRAYVIADNRLAELAEWDKGILAIELQHLVKVDVDVDVALTGFDTPEIDILIGNDAEPDNDEPATPLPPKRPVSRTGDLWSVGRHLILCGDARSHTDLAALTGGTAVDLVVTDVPYNVKVSGHVSGKGRARHSEFAMASGEMSSKEFEAFLQAVIETASKVMTPASLAYLWIDWRHLPEMLAAGGSVFGPLHNLGVWVKTNAGMGSHYRSQHELCCIFKHGKGTHVNNVQLGAMGRYRSNVWIKPGANTFRRGRDRDLADHPTVKPTGLIADIILDSSNPKDVVLDHFLGSGSTLLACEKTGRVGRGLEIDPGYVDVALRRLALATGTSPTLVKTRQTFDEVAKERLGKDVGAEGARR